MRINTFVTAFLYDKGYHMVVIKTVHDLATEVMIAIPTVPAQATDPVNNVGEFQYNMKEDHYQCKQKNTFKTIAK